MSAIRELFGQIEPVQGKSDSVLIVSAGFEERSTAVVQRLAENYAADHVFIFRSIEYRNMGRSTEHFKFIEDKVRKVSAATPTVIEFSVDHSITSMALFEQTYLNLRATSTIETVTVDVTTFPRQELLILLRILDSQASVPKRLFYGEAIKYGTEEPDGWLTRGVKSVRPVPGFGGFQPPNKRKNLLVMFLGHEDERAAITWKRHQPRKTIAIVPDPNYRSELDGIVLRTHQPLFTKLGVTEFYPSIPARGIQESEAAILDIWEKHHDTYYMVVAPLGTKLQMLGVYRAIRQKRDIQITYAIPSVYNYENYSVGIGRVWEVIWT